MSQTWKRDNRRFLSRGLIDLLRDHLLSWLLSMWQVDSRGAQVVTMNLLKGNLQIHLIITKFPCHTYGKKCYSMSHVSCYKCVTQLLQMCHTVVTNVSHSCYKIGHHMIGHVTVWKRQRWRPSVLKNQQEIHRIWTSLK